MSVSPISIAGGDYWRRNEAMLGARAKAPIEVMQNSPEPREGSPSHRTTNRFQSMLFETFAADRAEVSHNFDNSVSPTAYHEHLNRSMLNVGKHLP